LGSLTDKHEDIHASLFHLLKLIFIMTERRYVDKTVTNIEDEALEHSIEEEMHLFRLQGNDIGYLRLQQQQEQEQEAKRKRDDDRIIQEFLAKSASKGVETIFSEDSVKQLKRNIEHLASEKEDGLFLTANGMMRDKKEEKLSTLKPNVIVVKKRKVDVDADADIVSSEASIGIGKHQLSSDSKASSELEPSATAAKGKDDVIHSLCEYGADSDEDS
jgi:hypothetical protein